MLPTVMLVLAAKCTSCIKNNSTHPVTWTHSECSINDDI